MQRAVIVSRNEIQDDVDPEYACQKKAIMIEDAAANRRLVDAPWIIASIDPAASILSVVGGDDGGGDG